MKKLGLFYDVIQYYMDSSDYDSIVRECKNLTENIKNPLDLEANEGDIDSHMYVKVLEYFVSECKGLNSETEAYKKVIGYIEIVINSIKEKKIPFCQVTLTQRLMRPMRQRRKGR